jgi:uncharacterized protein
MKNIIIAILLLLCANFILNAQIKSKPLSSGYAIQKAFELEDSSWFQQAIDTLLTISPNDTGYVNVLTELSYAYMNNKEYQKALNTADLAYSYNSALRHRLILIKGNTYDNWGHPDSSIIFYQKALKKYPYSYLIYFNLGISYTNAKNYDLAIKSFQQAIRLNPYHASSHLALGRLMAQMGQYVHAILSLETFLMIEPNTPRANSVLVFLNNLVNNSLSRDFVEISPTTDNKTFSELDKLIKAKVVVDSKYKTNIKFNAAIVNQTHLLFQSVEYKPNTNDFWMEYYMPIFSVIKKNNHFEDLIYNILSSVNNKDLSNQVKKHKKSIGQMNSDINIVMAGNHKKQIINEDGQDITVDFFLDINDNIASVGIILPDNQTRIGNWKFFYPNCELKAEGKYNDSGKLDGKWINYNNDGSISYIENYINGKLEGEYTGYYPDGKIKYQTNYKDNTLNNDVIYYYKCNAVSSKVHYTNDAKNGPSQSFYEDGTLKEDFSYINDSISGEYKSFYPNGSIQTFYIYSNNKFNGKALKYYDNGKIKTEDFYSNNILNGKHTEFDMQGRVILTGSYKNGKAVGTWSEFNKYGKLKESYIFDDAGRLNGEYKDWDQNGNLYSVYIYNQDKLREATNYNKSGQTIYHKKLDDKDPKIIGYYADGTVNYEGSINKGNIDGQWKYFYNSGQLSYIKNLKDQAANGPYISYYPQGAINEKYNFVNGEVDGYYIKYFENGKINIEGWYNNGVQDNTWNYYYPDGALERSIYFSDGEIEGNELDYSPEHTLQFKTLYKDGEMVSMIDYTPEGKEFNSIKFDGSNNYTLYYFDKKIRIDASFKCYCFDSIFSFFDKNGNIESRTTYKNNKRNGLYVSYYPNKTIKSEGNYVNGKQEGLWKYYFEDGTLKQKGIYLNDEKDSIWINYHENGKVFKIKNLMNDTPVDTSKYYDPKGDFMFSLIFNEFGLSGYQYSTSNGLKTVNISSKDSGIIKTFYLNGNKSAELSYKFGMLEGKQIYYYSNGNKFQDYFLINDKLDGISNEYYENGKPKFTENYLLGLQHGKSVYYYPSGTIKSSKEFKYNDEHGSHIFFSIDGKIQKTLKFWGSIQL